MLSVYVLVDPLTLGGQRGASVVELLSAHLRLPVTGDPRPFLSLFRLYLIPLSPNLILYIIPFEAYLIPNPLSNPYPIRI